MSNLEGSLGYAELGLEDHILENVITFFQYGLLELGAYYNINNQSDYQGNNPSILHPMSIHGSSGYTIYRGAKHDWVWESNINLKASGLTQPISISGIIVNGTFYATGTTITGTGFIVDYARGQVVFDRPLSSGYTVKCPHTDRWVGVYKQDSYEYRKLTYDWIQNTGASGVAYSNEETIYLPAIIIGIESYETVRGLELGSRAKVSHIGIEFDILAGNDFERKKLLDICYFLETKGLPLYNISTAPKPLLSNGALSSGAKTWPMLVSGYSVGNAMFNENAKIEKVKRSTLPVKHGKAFITLEADVFPI